MTGVAREWVVFDDPADRDHEIRADLSWLLSRWRCIYGQGCPGIVAGGAAQGCCSHGAFFTDRADEQRVRAAARQLSDTDWQRHGAVQLVTTDLLDGVPARRTRTVDGGCVFLNGSEFAAGPGCALHRLALRTGRHPLTTKPDVCWQLPISHPVEDLGNGRRRSTVTEFMRSSWGQGGAELHWWCTESAAAHTSSEALFRSYRAELEAMLGGPAYRRLAELCEHRLAGHPPPLALNG